MPKRLRFLSPIICSYVPQTYKQTVKTEDPFQVGLSGVYSFNLWSRSISIITHIQPVYIPKPMKVVSVHQQEHAEMTLLLILPDKLMFCLSLLFPSTFDQVLVLHIKPEIDLSTCLKCSQKYLLSTILYCVTKLVFFSWPTLNTNFISIFYLLAPH